MTRARTWWRAAVAASVLLSVGVGCVAYNAGEPVSFTHSKFTVRTDRTNELLAVTAGVTQPTHRGGYTNATVQLMATVRTTTWEDTDLDKLTLTSQRRIAVGFFPGAAMTLRPSKAPDGAVPIGPMPDDERQLAWSLGSWRGGFEGQTGVIGLTPFASIYTLLFAPFTTWSYRGRFLADGSGRPLDEGCRIFPTNELAACGMRPALDRYDLFNVDGWRYAGLIGVFKYPDLFVRRETMLALPQVTTIRTNQWPVRGFEVELRIPELGFQATQRTGYTGPGTYGDQVVFPLPTDARAEDLVPVREGEANPGGEPGQEVRRRYRALVSFRPLDRKLSVLWPDYKREAWARAEGRTFETSVCLERGAADRGSPPSVVNVVKEVHHVRRTLAETARDEGPAREFEVEKAAGDGGRTVWRVRILSDAVDEAEADRKAKPQILASLRAEFAERHPEASPGDVHAWAAYRTEDGGRTLVYEGVAESAIPELESLAYSARTRSGTLTMRLPAGADLRRAKQFVRENISAIACDKNVALTVGERPPDGARYRSVDENYEDGVLTVEFEAEE